MAETSPFEAFVLHLHPVALLAGGGKCEFAAQAMLQ